MIQDSGMLFVRHLFVFYLKKKKKLRVVTKPTETEDVIELNQKPKDNQ